MDQCSWEYTNWIEADKDGPVHQGRKNYHFLTRLDGYRRAEQVIEKFGLAEVRKVARAVVLLEKFKSDLYGMKNP